MTEPAAPPRDADAPGAASAGTSRGSSQEAPPPASGQDPAGAPPPADPHYHSGQQPTGHQSTGHQPTGHHHSDPRNARRASHHRRKSRVRGPPNREFVLTERIGKGSFATVYKGEWGGDLGPSGGPRQTIAVKIVQRSQLKRDKRLLDNFEAEMAILKQMKHPHIVHLIDVVQTSSDFNLIMEYCSLSDLSNFIRKKQSLIRDSPVAAAVFARYPQEVGLHPTLVRHFLAQLASSLVFLREHDLMHRDVKPQNLLLMPPAKTEDQARAFGYVGQWDLPVLKIADFGFARFLPAASMAETLCGSPLYMAPEILKGQMYNATADLWSVGAVAYEMVTGKPPFPAANHIELSKKIEDAKDNIQFPCAIDADIEAIIRGLLTRQPDGRMGFDEFFARSMWPAARASAASEMSSATTSTTATATPPTVTESSSAPGIVSPAASGPPSMNSSGSTGVTSQEFDSQRLRYSAYLRHRGASDIAVESPTPSPESSHSHHQLADQATPSSHDRTSGDKPSGDKSQASRASRASASAGGQARPSGAATTPATNNTTGARQGKTSESENDYVFVEKRMVEVNSLADDLASPTLPGHRLTNPEHKVRRRRLSSIAYGASPTSALAQALLKSSTRLFGAKPDPAVSPIPLSIVSAVPQASEKQALNDLEQLATIGKIVSLYADVKYAQLDAGNDNADNDNDNDGEASASLDREGSPPHGKDSGKDQDRSSMASALFPVRSPSQLDPFFQQQLAQEALVLYLKALSVLASAMARAAEWWEQHTSGQSKAKAGPASPGINALVQWTRDKFNECVVRAEKSRELVKQHTAEAGGSGPQACAERLLFDRALEMAKTAAGQEAAVAEAVDAAASISGSASAGAAAAAAAAANEAAAACEMNYGTAVWMLRALLEYEQPEDALSDDDRVMVDTLMGKIAQRLAALRRKASFSRSRSQTPEPSQRGAGVHSSLASSRVSFSRLTPP